MILTLIASALAGWGARPAEPRITETFIGVVGQDRIPSEPDRRVLSLLVCLLGAALFLWMSGVPVRPGVFVLGAALGYFQKDLREAIVSRGRD